MSWQDLNTAILAEAQVTLVDGETDGTQLQRTTGIDLDGSYYFDNVPNGRYELTVTLPNVYQVMDLNPVVVEIEPDGVVELVHTVVRRTDIEPDASLMICPEFSDLLAEEEQIEIYVPFFQ